MSNIKTLQRSFNGGEVSPEMSGQIADAKYQSGAARMRNFIARVQGPAENRAGFAFVREVKNSAQRVRLIPFTYSTTQTMVIEFGAGYFRFHTQGETLLDGNGNPYELENPYAEEDIFGINYVQSADVMTLVHQNYPPMELRRLGAANWQLATINFLPPLSPPINLRVTQTVMEDTPHHPIDYDYVVTAIAQDGISESAASVHVTCQNNLYTSGNKNTLNWDAVGGAWRYCVYLMMGGLYGYIGQTDKTTFVDDSIGPDMSRTPPIYDTVFQPPDGIVSVSVVANGHDYGTAFTGGGITVVRVTSGGLYPSVSPTTTPSPILTVSDPTGSGAVFVVNCKYSVGHGGLSGGYFVDSITVKNPGSGYTQPVFILTGWTGTPPAYTPVVAPIVHATPQLKVVDSTGNGAVISPVVENGHVISVIVVSGGSGYTNPVVQWDKPAGGTGATFGPPVIGGADYPAAVSYYQQRRCFAGTRSRPQQIWMTRSGTESGMSYSLPIRDDDRVSFRVAAREANTIRHIVPLTQLLLLTNAAEWRVTSVNSDALTPATISVNPQSYVGASDVQPVVINNTLIYCAARGGHVRELAYSWQANGFVTGDLSLRSAHLFDNFSIVDMAYAKAPQPLIWFVSSTGKLLGLTYVPEQQIGAWHQHDTKGTFESCCVVAEGAEDVLYCVVRREISNQQVRYIERMASRQFGDPADAFFVDCGATYTGSPTKTITGLDWLEGEKVSILGDGAVMPQQVVVDGTITLPHPASKVQIGLPIVADLQTLPIAAQVDNSFGQGRYKNVNKAWLRVYRSSGIWIGPDAEKLTEAKQRTTEPPGYPPALKSEEVQVMVTPSWGDSGQIFVRQSDPLPLTVVSLTLEVALGG
jgi:hypothetical protein